LPIFSCTSFALDTGINSSLYEFNAFVSPDERYILFTSSEERRILIITGLIIVVIPLFGQFQNTIAFLAIIAFVIHSGFYRNQKLMFFNNRDRFLRYLRAILIGLPVWYVIGILIRFSAEFAKQFGITGFDQPKALMLQYVALAFGDMGAGIISNIIKSRKKALLIFYGIVAFYIFLFFALKGGGSAFNMYLLCMGLGFGSGISVLYITMSAEQFGTNLRATAAISIPNLVRGFLPLIIILFKFLRSDTVFSSYVTAAWVTGIVILLTGFISVLNTRETFGKELNFVEK
jgi:putative MFS transporter